jgi:serine/threonine protein kinase
MNGRSAREIEKAIFDATSGIGDPVVRQEFLNRACAADDTMLSRIAGLLRAQEAAEEFFRTATIARAEVGGDVVSPLDEGLMAAGRSDSSESHGPGERIGRYLLLERIGEGGCGVVFLAEQNEPVRRKVALKVIRQGLDTESVIARFEIERQSLALMDHPNIARVLDVGTTESGRPFFVMELVHGQKITHHCDTQRLGLRPRLELFIQVCHAIQHAHQKGVIHRDIKPSNLLVTTLDGQAAPKVIDFGIARAVGGGFSDDTRITLGSQLMGTPAYMSPEQAEGCLDLDTRADIYSLGVLLYELLTGRPPFDGKRLAQAGLLEMLRILREEEPITPSALLGGLNAADLSAAAASRDTAPKSLIAALRGDLDGIILKALAKDRQSRYATVAGLAADVRRHLNDEPVSVRPPGQFYLFSKLVRRNKMAFAAVMLIALALIGGGAVSSWFYMREREARQAVEAARGNEAVLLKKFQAREIVAQAAILLGEGKVAQVDAWLANTPLASIEPTSEALVVYRAYGEWKAILGRWDKAVECFDLFEKAGGFRRIPYVERRWMLMSTSVAQVEAGNLKAYDRFRESAISDYGKTDDYISGATVIKSCLLAPAGSNILEGLKPCADMVAARLDSRSTGNIDAEQGAFAAMSMALMEYRKGNFSRAQEWCRKSQEFPDSNDTRNATVHAIGAMAAQNLGQLEAAHSELALAQAASKKIFTPDPFNLKGRWQIYWQDGAIARVLIKEAENLRRQNPF